MSEYSDSDRLFEELTLVREFVDPEMPLFSCLSKNLSGRQWDFWGRWTVPAKWNPDNKKTILHKNKEGKLHRVYGPALINELYNEEAWFFDGKFHRDGSWAYRRKEIFVWFKHGKLHNLEGPAVVDPAGPLQYWIDGVQYTRKQYKWEIQRRKKLSLKNT